MRIALEKALLEVVVDGEADWLDLHTKCGWMYALVL